MSSPEPVYTIQVGTGDLAAALVQREIGRIEAEIETHKLRSASAENLIETLILQPLGERILARYEGQLVAMRTLCNGFEMLMKRPCTMVAPAPFSTSTSRFSQYIYAAKNSRSALHGARVQKGDVLRARWSITCEMNGKDVDLYSAELCESISGSEIEDTNRWLEDIEQAYYAIHSLSDKLADLPRIEREARARLTETFLSKQPELLAQLDAVFPRMLAKDEAG